MTPDDPHPPIDDNSLSASLRGVRDQLTIRNRTKELCLQLQKDWEAYRKDAMDGKETGASPVHTLKLEAVALVSAMADFHCSCARELDEVGARAVAHNWVLDEGMLRSAACLLAHVDTETL